MEIGSKKEVIEKWLKKEGFRNIKFTENNRFVKADAVNNKILILVKDNDDYFDKLYESKDIYEFAYKNGQRQIWTIDVIGNQEVKWDLYN